MDALATLAYDPGTRVAWLVAVSQRGYNKLEALYQ
jgi:hypothetical protein